MENYAEIRAEIVELGDYCETEEIVELVELSEESAMSELAAFGFAEPWFFGEPDLNEMFGFWCDERRLNGEEWDAWNDATDDMAWRFFELDVSM